MNIAYMCGLDVFSFLREANINQCASEYIKSSMASGGKISLVGNTLFIWVILKLSN